MKKIFLALATLGVSILYATPISCTQSNINEKVLISEYNSGHIVSLDWDADTSRGNNEVVLDSGLSGFIDISYNSEGRLFAVDHNSHLIELNPTDGTYISDKGAISGSTPYESDGDYPAVALLGDSKGYLYSGVSKNGKRAIVKFKANNVNSTELVLYTDSINDGGYGGDLAWSKGFLYQTIYNTQTQAINLVKMDINTQQIIYNKTIKNENGTTFSTHVIPMYSDSKGNLFVIKDQNIYYLDLDTLQAHYKSSYNDNASGPTGATTTHEPCGSIKKEKTFRCDGTMYFSNETALGSVGGTTGSMYLHSINTKKSPFSFNQIGESYNHTYNALAYNPQDNFLYATHGNKLLKIDKDGNIEDLGVIEELSTNQKYSATFDKDGYYYIGDWQDRSKIYKIDVKTKKIVETMKLDTPLYYIDMTIAQNGSDKYLYVLNRSEFNTSGGKKNQLVKINISQIKSNGKYGYETIGDKVVDEEAADSIFYDAADKLYVLLHKGGFYQIDTTTGKRIPISSAPELANLNDGAVCPNATIKLKPTISLGDATVVEGDNGTTELIFPVRLINNTHPKSLTYKYRVYDGNNTNKSTNAKSPKDYLKNDYSTTVVQELSHDSEIRVTVNGDTHIEKDEILQVILQEVNGALIADNKAIGTILNDDNSNIFTAYDIGDVNKKIKTKIVGSDFLLTLAKVDSHGNSIVSVDENNTKVRIVDSSKCLHPFDGNMAGFVSFDMGTNSEITSSKFNSSIAIKKAKIQFYWEDALGEHTSCSSDLFSIRPDHYDVHIPLTITAGSDFDITISAMGADGSVVSNYIELASSYTLDINDTKANVGCTLGSFSKKEKRDFVSGISTVTLNYTNIGNLKFKAIEVQTADSEYANIDKDDGSGADRFITTGESEKFINPAKIQAVFNFKTQNSLPFTYFSDNPYEMGALIEANITMLSANDKKVTNFSNSCWASDVDISIDYNQEKGAPSQASFSDDDNPDLGNIIHANKVTYKITKDKFTDANARKSLYLNFGRDIQTPKAPIQIKLSSPKVTLSSGLNTSVVEEKTYTFAYVRANSAPEQSVVGDTIIAKVDYELYIPSGINKANYGLNTLHLSENGGTWYTLPTDVAFGYEKNPKLRYGNGAHISTSDNYSVTVNVLKTPHTNRVVYYPKEYLLFNKFSDKATSHSFKINLYSDTKQWSGKGREGIIVDEDVSKNVVKKMNW